MNEQFEFGRERRIKSPLYIGIPRSSEAVVASATVSSFTFSLARPRISLHSIFFFFFPVSELKKLGMLTEQKDERVRLSK